MSMELFVILAASNAPDTDAWNRALAEARVPAHMAATTSVLPSFTQRRFSSPDSAARHSSRKAASS